MKILLTGGAGYIGSVLVPHLLSMGFKVIVVDNFMYHQTSLLDYCWDKDLTVIRGDVRDGCLMNEQIRKVDVILPFASLIGASRWANDPIGAKTINLDAIKMILDYRSQDQILIYPGINFIYGAAKDDICTEETPLNPVSFYAHKKVEIENLILSEQNCISLRLPSIFGTSPKMQFHPLVNDFTYRAVTDHFIVLFEAHYKRSYLHVRDVARAFIHAIIHFDKMKNQAYNVGLNEYHTKWELCEEIKKQVPNFFFVEENHVRDPEQRSYIVSNAKIEATGFQPIISLREGIAELIKGYQIIRNTQFDV